MLQAGRAHQLAQGEAPIVVEVGVAGVQQQSRAEVLNGCSVRAQAVMRDPAVVQRVAAAGIHRYRRAVIRQRRLVLPHLSAMK